MQAGGGSGCGAAIYMDSTSAELTLRYNIFFENRAHEDKAVFNCGEYESVEYNWWGVNDPEFNEPYLVEWHKIGSNEKHSDDRPLRPVITWGNEPTHRLENGTINLKFVTRRGIDLTDSLNGYEISLIPDKKAIITATDKKYSFIFTPLEAGEHKIRIELESLREYLYTNIRGEFTELQELVNNSDGVLNLERDYTFSEGVDTFTEGIVINKPLTINGNGHTINGLDKSRIFKITSEGVTINNVNLTHGKASEGGAIYIEGDNAQILNSYFRFNASDIGGAIRWVGSNGKVLNSTFLDNTASVKSMEVKSESGILIFTFNR